MSTHPFTRIKSSLLPMAILSFSLVGVSYAATAKAVPLPHSPKPLIVGLVSVNNSAAQRAQCDAVAAVVPDIYERSRQGTTNAEVMYRYGGYAGTFPMSRDSVIQVGKCQYSASLAVVPANAWFMRAIHY